MTKHHLFRKCLKKSINHLKRLVGMLLSISLFLFVDIAFASLSLPISASGNTLKAVGNVSLTSTQGDIPLQNTAVSAGDGIALDAAKDILLESGQSQQNADGSNRHAGLSVGVGASLGAQTGIYIYGEAGWGSGENHLNINNRGQTPFF